MKYKLDQKVKVHYGGIFWPDVEFTITSIGANHGGMGKHRYWGVDARGRGHGAYEDQIQGVVT